MASSDGVGETAPSGADAPALRGPWRRLTATGLLAAIGAAATLLAPPGGQLQSLIGPGNRVAAALPLVDSAAVAAVLSLVTAMLWQRSRAAFVERAVWHRFALAGAALAAAQLIQLALLAAGELGAPVAGFVDEPARAAVLLSCPLLYQGMVRWNRYRTATSDPGDWLNGIGAAFALAALVSLIVHWTAPSLAEWSEWEFNGWLLRVASVAVVAGTAATVARLGGLQADLRLWLVTAGFCTLLLAQTAAEVVTSAGVLSALPRVVGLIAILAVAKAAQLPPAQLRPREASAESTAVGSLVVLLASVAILAINSWFPSNVSDSINLFALVAVVSVSTRVMHIVRELSMLATTRQLALTDELTEVANRRALMLALAAKPSGGRGRSLLVLDLDRFKHVNDRLGHGAGDRLLREISGRLRAESPPSALLARLGGDEFAVLLEGSGAGEALRVGAALAAAIARPVPVKGHRLEVGSSIGVATSEPGPSWADAEELLRQADTAMYQAKAAGGGVELYDRRADTEHGERARLGDELRSVLDPRPDRPRAGTVVAFFQPQLELASGQVVGVEALVRWQHPRLGLLTPDRFLELADERGLMAALTETVLRHAAVAVQRWQAEGLPLRVSVNLSAGCLVDPQLLPLVDRVLAETGLPPHQLVLEVTETGLMADPAGSINTLHAIAARGVGVSIDDYGTGYSSLAYLNDLPADELKIDRAFTAGLLQDPRTEAIVATTIELAHRLGLRVVAEGVEDEPTMRALEALGCDHSQGYFHGKPVAVAEFERWLRGAVRAVPPTGQALRAS